jgi:hypothetical protein
MAQLNHLAILDSATVADDATSTEHFTGFVNAFIENTSRERWLHFLLKRPKQVFRNARKLRGCLDSSRCTPLDDMSIINQSQEGIYYDFFDEPVILTAAEAFVVGPNREGILSLIPGQLAVYFSHEGEILLCKI